MIRLQDQLSYDNFHLDQERTYWISEYVNQNGEQWKMAGTPLPIKEVFAKENQENVFVYFGLVVTEPAPLLFFSQVSYAGVLLPSLVST